ncbi:hypothetical protein GE061_009078 [Apolygus lucorum]|uniref:H15 domain-containing protein n=1 Tax=Apolygus lucorum TaxID=248454 RepID=A0A8S9Y1B7_APOLU|nr:hypothetical protein GE061_009078 [Apolygus lucorum]
MIHLEPLSCPPARSCTYLVGKTTFPGERGSWDDGENELMPSAATYTMTETTASAPASEPPKAKSPKKKAAAGGAKAAGKPKTKPSHPPTATMVNAAIRTLKERGGSSLQAIKKYISSTYKVDAEKLAPFIRKYIKSAVTAGKLGGKKKAAKPKAAKKAASPKKEKKQPSKAKKAKKPPTTPKAPKPKKTTKSPAKPKKPVAKKVAKKPAAKKAAPKKK